MQEDQMPKTLLELKNLRKPLRNTNKEHEASLSRLEVLALRVGDEDSLS